MSNDAIDAEVLEVSPDGTSAIYDTEAPVLVAPAFLNLKSLKTATGVQVFIDNGLLATAFGVREPTASQETALATREGAKVVQSIEKATDGLVKVTKNIKIESGSCLVTIEEQRENYEIAQNILNEASTTGLSIMSDVANMIKLSPDAKIIDSFTKLMGEMTKLAKTQASLHNDSADKHAPKKTVSQEESDIGSNMPVSAHTTSRLSQLFEAWQEKTE